MQAAPRKILPMDDALNRTEEDEPTDQANLSARYHALDEGLEGPFLEDPP